MYPTNNFVAVGNPSIDILELASRMPNAILQINAGDLCEFANQLISQAAGVARLQMERADLSKEMLTTEEVAAMLKVSKMTLYRWVKQGLLSKIEVGGRRLYRRSDVEALTVKRQSNRKSK